MKCYKKLFDIDEFLNNYGNFILLPLIIIDISCVIFFIIKGFKSLIKRINHIKSNNKSNNSLNNNIINNTKKNKNKSTIKAKKHKNKKTRKINNKKNNPIKKKQPKKHKSKIKVIKKEKEHIDEKSASTRKLNKSKSNIMFTVIKNKNSKNNKYNDQEINTLLYKNALKIDKRTYIEYYISLLKRRQMIIFTFFTTNDYNSRSIKISLFLLSFALYFTVNTLFFNDSTMHKIYKDKGKFNFIYQLLNILYSTLISSIINIILKFLSLSENKIIEIKNNDKKDNINKIKKCFKIKFILFYILNFILLLSFWFYVSCFCAVYKNTQIHLIKDTLVSFGLSLLYPFGLCLLPGIFRIPSLRASKQDKECVYKFSQFIENLSFCLTDC